MSATGTTESAALLSARAALAVQRADPARTGAFPDAAWAAIAEAGLPAATVAGASAVRELGIVRAAGAADVALGRLLDGHLNAVERLRVQVGGELARTELDGVAAGQLRLGVWGADPGPGEGAPAGLCAGGRSVSGVKVFCSGAGGLHRAFVLVRAPGDPGPLRLAYVDLTAGVTVDEGWYGGDGMRASASHRVVFDAAEVLWVDPEPRALLREPWFSRDALRTAASWVGGADAAVDDALATLRAKGAAGDLEALAAGRLETHRRTLGLWLAEAARAMDAGEELRALAAHARDAIAATVRATLDEASRACGSRPFAVGGPLERARADLQTYLLQHRLEPIVARAGRALLEAAPEDGAG